MVGLHGKDLSSIAKHNGAQAKRGSTLVRGHTWARAQCAMSAIQPGGLALCRATYKDKAVRAETQAMGSAC